MAKLSNWALAFISKSDKILILFREIIRSVYDQYWGKEPIQGICGENESLYEIDENELNLLQMATHDIYWAAKDLFPDDRRIKIREAVESAVKLILKFQNHPNKLLSLDESYQAQEVLGKAIDFLNEANSDLIQTEKQSGEEPPEWFKAITEIKKNNEKYTTFSLWQAAAIAHAVLELANWIEVVGDKKSTLNKIDAIRKAIVYTNANQIYPKYQDGQANLKLTELHDLLLNILDEILPYYKSVNKMPAPTETVEKLKKQAKQLQQFAGEYNEHVPLETVTDEMRQLADDVLHYNYPDICLTGKASGISYLLGAIACDLYESQKLTEVEIEAKSYLSQSVNLLSEFSAKRSWPKDENEQQQFKTKISEGIIYFADKLDKSPIIKQYHNFSKIIKDEKVDLVNQTETNQAENSGSETEIINIESKERFTFTESQAFFDNKDINLPSGSEVKPVEVLKLLVDNFNMVVPYEKLEKTSKNEASDSLRGKIRKINQAMKQSEIPCKITSNKWQGYVIKNHINKS